MLTLEELRQLQITPPDQTMTERARAHWDSLFMPLDGLGRFQNIVVRIAGILGREEFSLQKRALVIMCADNGIVDEHVSQSTQEMTAHVTRNMAKRRSTVCMMASTIACDVHPVDIGISESMDEVPGLSMDDLMRISANDPIGLHGLIHAKVRAGTRDFAIEPAMTEKEALKAIRIGMDIAEWHAEHGYELIALGEMGIGNTTTSSALAAVCCHLPVAEVTGRGAGLSSEGVAHKCAVIEKALRKYELTDDDPFQALCCVGGLDIAGLIGLCIGGARFHLPVVLDGVITTVAAYLAERLVPGVRDYLIPSHMSREPAMRKLTEYLNLEPIIEGNLALGEGTGAVLLLPMLDMALSVYRKVPTFEEEQSERYQRLS